MGNTCCTEQKGHTKADKGMYWKAEGNLETEPDCPPESKATRVSNRLDEIKEIHARFLKCELAQTLDQNMGENYGPYKYHKDNGIYYGQYRSGLRHGHGIWISQTTNTSYEGIWKNDQMDGPGALLYPNGDTTLGNLLKFQPNGLAKFTSADGNQPSLPNIIFRNALLANFQKLQLSLILTVTGQTLQTLQIS